MAMTCKICVHPKRLEIDRQLVQGGSIAQIARFFAVEYDSLYRHQQSHLSRQLVATAQKQDLANNFDLLNRIETIIQRANDIFERNYLAKKDLTALKGLAEGRSAIELLAKISYGLAQAREAEVALLREQNHEGGQEQMDDFTDRLKVLTTPELKILQAIETKLTSQDPRIDILGDYLASLHTEERILNPEIRTEPSEQGNLYHLPPAHGFIRTRHRDKPSPLEAMQVREINPTVIPG